MTAKEIWEQWQTAAEAKNENLEAAFCSLLEMLAVEPEDVDLTRQGYALLAECRERLLSWIDKHNLHDHFDGSLEGDYAEDDDEDAKARRRKRYRSIDDN